jgi:hypothetical protein
MWYNECAWKYELQEWHLHHDNAPPHSIVDLRVLGKVFDSCPSRTSLFPDISPPDVFMFSRIEITLEGRRFQMVEDIIMNSTDELRVIHQTSFEWCFQK